MLAHFNTKEGGSLNSNTRWFETPYNIYIYIYKSLNLDNKILFLNYIIMLGLSKSNKTFLAPQFIQ